MEKNSKEKTKEHKLLSQVGMNRKKLNCQKLPYKKPEIFFFMFHQFEISEMRFLNFFWPNGLQVKQR